MENIDPIFQTLGVGGMVAAAAWGIWSKLRSQTAADSASASASSSVEQLIEQLNEQNDRLAKQVTELALQYDGASEQLRCVKREATQRYEALEAECNADRKQFGERIQKTELRIEELTIAINQCQMRHLEREQLDELGRTGVIDRRKSKTTRSQKT
jgi:septation ring formation regulator EzrA